MKWPRRRITGIWFHISLKTIDGAVRISTEVTKSGTQWLLDSDVADAQDD
jgi:hypothetical protein